MTYLKSFPKDAGLPHLYQAYPETAKPLLEYIQVLLRGSSPLSVGQRELIAAYVSALNACHFCIGLHQATAARFGVSEAVLAELMAEVQTAQVDEKLKPILEYVRKLTLSPAKMTAADAEAVYAVGWDDRALHDTVSVCALFNFMNRLVDGLGIDADGEYFQIVSEQLAKGGYVRPIKL